MEAWIIMSNKLRSGRSEDDLMIRSICKVLYIKTKSTTYHSHFKPNVILVVTSAAAQGKQIKAVPLTMVYAPPYQRLQVTG